MLQNYMNYDFRNIKIVGGSLEIRGPFVVSFFVEVKETNAGNYIIKDLIYLEFYRGYNIIVI